MLRVYYTLAHIIFILVSEITSQVIFILAGRDGARGRRPQAASVSPSCFP